MNHYGQDFKKDLVTLQNCFQNQIQILKEISALDTILKSLSGVERPDMKEINICLTKKDKLLTKLNDESEISSMYLTSLSPYLNSYLVKNDPDFKELHNLIHKTGELMDQVCTKEDFDIYHIKKNLEDFRQILIKEFSMKDIPLTNRQIIL